MEIATFLEGFYTSKTSVTLWKISTCSSELQFFKVLFYMCMLSFDIIWDWRNCIINTSVDEAGIFRENQVNIVTDVISLLALRGHQQLRYWQCGMNGSLAPIAWETVSTALTMSVSRYVRKYKCVFMLPQNNSVSKALHVLDYIWVSLWTLYSERIAV